MSVKRIYVEKKEPFAVAAKELRHEIRGYLGIKTVTKVRELIRYDVENISEDIYRKAVNTIFSEPPVDDVYENSFPAQEDDLIFLWNSFPVSLIRERILQNSVSSF